jgi:hypothetical protein
MALFHNRVFRVCSDLDKSVRYIKRELTDATAQDGELGGETFQVGITCWEDKRDRILHMKKT